MPKGSSEGGTARDQEQILPLESPMLQFSVSRWQRLIGRSETSVSDGLRCGLFGDNLMLELLGIKLG